MAEVIWGLATSHVPSKHASRFAPSFALGTVGSAGGGSVVVTTGPVVAARACVEPIGAPDTSPLQPASVTRPSTVITKRRTGASYHVVQLS